MSEQAKHAARARENPDPHEQNRPVPKLVLLVVAGIVAWAIGYITLTQNDDKPELGDHRSMATLAAKPAGAGGGAVDGAQVYAANCVACHQATGAGLPGVFPPLAGSEWVLAADKVPVRVSAVRNAFHHGLHTRSSSSEPGPAVSSGSATDGR